MLSRNILIIGNGPSLAKWDLHDFRGIDSIGMNAAYRHWNRIGWYPTYYCCLDPVVLESHKSQIKALIDNIADNGIKLFLLRDDIFTFFPELKKNQHIVTLENIKRNQQQLLFNTPHITTGSFACRYAISLGYQNIYLLGIDSNYINYLPESRKIGDIKLLMTKTPKQNPNYFFPDYQQKGDRYQVPNHDKKYICRCRHCGGKETSGQTLHLDSWKFLAQDLKLPHIITKFGSIKMINCNPNSGVRDFPFGSPPISPSK